MIGNSSKQFRLRLSAFSLALVASLAFAGLVSASASAVSIKPGGNFTMSSGLMSFAVAPQTTMTCKNIGGTGNVSGSTGTLNLAFQGCKIANLYNCTTPGQPAGTILSKPLSVNIDYIAYLSPRYGIGVKPTTGSVFAEYECQVLSGKRTLGGGFIAEVTTALNSPFNTANLQINKTSESTPEHKWLQATQKWLESGGKEGYFYTYALTESRPGFSPVNTALQVSSPALNFAGTQEFLP